MKLGRISFITLKALASDQGKLTHSGLLYNLTVRFILASYPGLPMFFNIHEKNQEGLVDFHDVMDVVCDDAHWYA